MKKINLIAQIKSVISRIDYGMHHAIHSTVLIVACGINAHATANTPGEKFSYCSNGLCQIATTNDFNRTRDMPLDLNFSCKKNNQYALTFDDGPSANYPRLLEILKRHNVKATFFVVGSNVQSADGKKWFEQALSDGHFMANHTLNHSDLTTLDETQMYEQVEQSRQAMLNVPLSDNVSSALRTRLEHSTYYVRPPYGYINSKVDVVFKKHNYIAVRWNADRYDWQMDGNDPQTTKTIVFRVSQQLSDIVTQQWRGAKFNHSILDLNHDFQNTTLDAVDKYIPLVKENGYEFVTMDECLGNSG